MMMNPVTRAVCDYSAALALGIGAKKKKQTLMESSVESCNECLQFEVQTEYATDLNFPSDMIASSASGFVTVDISCLTICRRLVGSP